MGAAGVKAEIFSKPLADGSVVVISPRDTRRRSYRIIYQGKRYGFRGEGEKKTALWRQEGLCRLAIKANLLEVRFPDLAAAFSISRPISRRYAITRAAHHLAPTAKASHMVYLSSSSTYGISEDSIPPKVVEIGWNESFAIARQQEIRPTIGVPQYQPVPDKFHYWILDMNNRRAYDPYTKTDFDRKRRDLGVPQSLRMSPPDL